MKRNKKNKITTIDESNGDLGKNPPVAFLKKAPDGRVKASIITTKEMKPYIPNFKPLFSKSVSSYFFNIESSAVSSSGKSFIMNFSVNIVRTTVRTTVAAAMK